MAAIESEIYFPVRLCDGIWLKQWESVSMPNFDKISQSTAEIKLLPFSENGLTPYFDKNFTEIVKGEPYRRGVKPKRGSKI